MLRLLGLLQLWLRLRWYGKQAESTTSRCIGEGYPAAQAADDADAKRAAVLFLADVAHLEYLV
jgi:hypothetical protein